MLTPSPAEIHKARADELADRGEIAAAKAEYEKALSLHPAYFQAHANLANLLLQEYEVDAAIGHFQEAVRLRPDIAELHDSLGRALAAGGVALAHAAFQEALRLKPSLASAQYNLGELSMQKGLFKEAREYYQLALDHAPNFPLAKLGLVGALIELGATSDAANRLTEFERQSRNNLSRKFNELRARLATAQGRHIEALAIWQDLVKSATDREMRSALTHLAELYDVVGDFAKAFEAFERANALSLGVFDRNALRSRVDHLIDLYNMPETGAVDFAAYSFPQMVFVLGMPRAGKSLTAGLMARHPKAFNFDESHSVGDMFAQYEDEITVLDANDIKRLARDYIEVAEDNMNDVGKSFRTGITHVISATPDNLWRLPLIRRLFPHAKIIRVQRHPLDVCMACYFKDFAGAAYAYSSDLEDLGFFFLQKHRLVTHWRDVLQIPMLEISYEDMVANPLEIQARIFDYVGLDVSAVKDQMQAHSPLDTSRVGHWRNYAKQLQPLLSALGAGECGECV